MGTAPEISFSFMDARGFGGNCQLSRSLHFGGRANFPLLWKTMAKVLMELGTTDGISAELDIVWGEHYLVQQLDYLHVPFQCHCFHYTGHLMNICPYLISGRFVLVRSSDMDLEQSF